MIEDFSELMKKKLLVVMIPFVLTSLFLVSPDLAAGEGDISSGSSPLQGDIDSCGDPYGNGGGGGGHHVAPLTIIGDDTISVGTEYWAEGGITPYHWALSPGSGAIDNTGRVTELAGCSDTVQVNVVDGISNKATKLTTRPISSLALAGTETPVAASQYSASGGIAPYTWSISCGTIDSTGRVADIANCSGSGTVTVADTCGTPVSMTVRFPMGRWCRIAIHGGRYGGLDCNYTFYSGSKRYKVLQASYIPTSYPTHIDSTFNLANTQPCPDVPNGHVNWSQYGIAPSIVPDWDTAPIGNAERRPFYVVIEEWVQ